MKNTGLTGPDGQVADPAEHQRVADPLDRAGPVPRLLEHQAIAERCLLPERALGGAERERALGERLAERVVFSTVVCSSGCHLLAGGPLSRPARRGSSRTLI